MGNRFIRKIFEIKSTVEIFEAGKQSGTRQSEPGNYDSETLIATVGKKETKITDTPEIAGSYSYRLAPADEVENEAVGKISDKSIILVDFRDNYIKVGEKPDPYVRIEFSGIIGQQTFSVELLNELPTGIPAPADSEITYWDIKSGNEQTKGTRADFSAKLYFYYGHFGLIGNMKNYIRVVHWDGHKWTEISDMATSGYGTGLDEALVNTTHFSIFAVARGHSDLGVEISLKTIRAWKESRIWSMHK